MADDSRQQHGRGPLDNAAARAELSKLLGWFYYERTQQADNRMEMAMDADSYDGRQWSNDDAQAVRDRGQMPLVFNQVAPMADWLIGTERRSRVDWKVLPRTEDDVEIAKVKTDVLKYVADINHAGFERSRAFSDAIKVGVGWVDDGARNDPTADPLYSRYEDWRCVLWDSTSYQYDLSDCRYIFRWKWVDEDVALAAFPKRRRQIQSAAEERTPGLPDDGFDDEVETDSTADGSDLIYQGSTSILADSRRSRVRLIECQYRKPALVHIVQGGPFDRAILNPGDHALAMAAAKSGSDIIQTTMMRMHIAVFTENDLLSLDVSPYRHNDFTLTPIWCYRTGRRRLPYGAIRRVRDIQQDLNKRASKSLHIINTRQIVTEPGAVDDLQDARDEVDRPDGVIVVNPGKRFEVQRDDGQTAGQTEMMTLDAQVIQRSMGVNDENLGRQTNAVSGEAIKARQAQGSVATTEAFDNLRLAVQVQGQKQLSLTEQFYTDEKVIRISGVQGKIDWLRINQPEHEPDGSLRYLNDITASAADFIVSDQDYAGSLRQVMFDSISALAQKLPAEVALRLLAIALSFSDLPNHDEITQQIRQAANIPDPDAQSSPEDQQAAAQQAAIKADAMQLQRQAAVAALQEQQAKVREMNARAAQIEAATAGGASQSDQATGAQSAAADEIDRLSQRLQQLQHDVEQRLAAIKSSADVTLEVARINADAKIQVAEITKASADTIDALAQRVAAMTPPNTNPEGAAPAPAPAAAQPGVAVTEDGNEN